MINAARILHLTEHPEQLSRETLYELRNILNRYPSFQVVRILYLRNLFLLNDSEFHAELNRYPLQNDSRSFLFHRTVGGRYALHLTDMPTSVADAHLSPADPVAPSAVVVSASSAGAPEVSGKYADRTFELIDRFLHKQHNDDELPSILTSEIPASIVEQDGPLDEGCFTETLAKVYIKQGRYERALEIMESLYAKNPKKSAYFAAQIQIIKELITHNL